MAELTQLQRYLIRKGELHNERSSWMDHWREVSTFLLPRNGRFLTSDRNKGEKKHNKIYDANGLRALRVLGAGLMSGMTSPARPWFALETADKDLMEFGPVKVWVNQVTELMRQVFSRSNTYRALHSMYVELGAFGTAASLMLKDFETVVHHYPMTIGEYSIATDARGNVNTLIREYDMTVANLVDEFGYKNCSAAVQHLYDRNAVDKWVTITHIVQPRTLRDPRSKLSRDMPIASCYFESGTTENKFLRESGFRQFPALCPRWDVAGGDIYGNSPGMEALGDSKQLQHNQFRKGQAIDFMVKPPLQVPAGMKNVQISTVPGGASFVDNMSAAGGIKTLFDVRLDLQHLLLDTQDTRKGMDETFYKNLFMMLAMDDRSNVTAREVAERHEEKLLMLGPVLERLHNELLKRKVDMAFDYMVEAGMLPPPPPELQGVDINVEFISILAQAQRMIGTGSIDRFTGMLGQIALVKPGVLDKFDEDEWADKYSSALGVDPTLIVANDKVAIIRKQRAEAMQAQAKQEQMAQTAQTAQTLAKAPTGEQNALTDFVSGLSGYGGPGQAPAV